MIDFEKMRDDFPILEKGDLIYFDSAATSLKPRAVINAATRYLESESANVHRGVYRTGKECSRKYEASRADVARFINAPAPSQVIFTANTTASIGMVARSLSLIIQDTKRRKILIPISEHHSNILPWFTLRNQGYITEFIKLTSDFRVDMADYKKKLNTKTALVAVAGATNVIGNINPVDEMCSLAHKAGALFLVDGAQSVPHLPVDVEASDLDFLVFSGHKILAPPGVGVLYGKGQHLERLEPLTWGGGTASDVTIIGFTPEELPGRLEGGTPDIGSVIGLGEAVRYLEHIGMRAIGNYETELLEFALEKMGSIPGITVYGPKETAGAIAIVSFSLKGWSSSELPMILDKTASIAVRSGNHCAAPLVAALTNDGAVRASLAFYNTKDEIEQMTQTLTELARLK